MFTGAYLSAAVTAVVSVLLSTRQLTSGALLLSIHSLKIINKKYIRCKGLVLTHLYVYRSMPECCYGWPL